MNQDINFNHIRTRRIIAVLVVLCLAVVFFVGFNTIRSKAKDIKRRADVKMLAKALDLYHDNHGYYLRSIDDWQGWDLTYEYRGGELNFLAGLKEEGLIDRMVRDPLNDDTFHYRYQKFNSGDYGCDKSFYILQITNFELSTSNNGYGQCPELNWVELAPNGYTIQVFD